MTITEKLSTSTIPTYAGYNKPYIVGVSCNRHIIILARPLSELLAHVNHNRLPSFGLVARIIKVFALAIFQWHLCDYALLTCSKGFCHSIKKENCVVSSGSFKKEYPYMIESAFYLVFKDCIPSIHEEVNVSDIREITVKSIVEYYREHERIEIIPKTRAMTIKNLLSSKVLIRWYPTL